MLLLALVLGVVDWILAVQVSAGAVGALLGVAAFVRAGKSEERSASREEVGGLWDENRALRTELGNLWTAHARLRIEHEQEGAKWRARTKALETETERLRQEHQECREELAALRRST